MPAIEGFKGCSQLGSRYEERRTPLGRQMKNFQSGVELRTNLLPTTVCEVIYIIIYICIFIQTCIIGEDR